MVRGLCCGVSPASASLDPKATTPHALSSTSTLDPSSGTPSQQNPESDPIMRRVPTA